MPVSGATIRSLRTTTLYTTSNRIVLQTSAHSLCKMFFLSPRFLGPGPYVAYFASMGKWLSSRTRCQVKQESVSFWFAVVVEETGDLRANTFSVLHALIASWLIRAPNLGASYAELDNQQADRGQQGHSTEKHDCTMLLAGRVDTQVRDLEQLYRSARNRTLGKQQ